MATRVREKTRIRKENEDKRPRATARYIRISSSKVRIVLNLIKGKSFAEAQAIVKNTPKAASEVILKVINSAGSNAEIKGMSKSDLFVADAYAEQGPSLKRVMPRAKGSASPILKRTCHVTVILDKIAEKASKEVADKVTEKPAKTTEKPVEKVADKVAE
jgi:large subunit ribosomal protein L22